MRAVLPLTLATCAALALALDADRLAGADPARALLAETAIFGHDYDEAKSVLATMPEDDPDAMIERARLAIYTEECDAALALLSKLPAANARAADDLLDIARGCARVTAATIVEPLPAAALEIRYQDEADKPLGSLVAEVVVRARESLSRDLGVTWPVPTRVTIVRDLLSLSAMTGLPYESAKTTGAVAVAKWGRVTLLSPRASHHGFDWKDTVAHELTHLAVTHATLDRAPLWLQEGVAKHEEVRWREPGPFDDRPPVSALVLRGMEAKLDLPLDKLGPSIAMLPSADAAMVAFAEVASFVNYLTMQDSTVLPKLFAELRGGKRVDEALRVVRGGDLAKLDKEWRAWLATRPKEAIPAAFGLGDKAPANLGEVRERLRLGELLLDRDHAGAGFAEIEQAKAPFLDSDPRAKALRARALLAKGQPDAAALLVADPKAVVGSYAPWWAIRGVLAAKRGEDDVAETSFVEGIGADPFDVDAACKNGGVDALPPTAPARALCEAARSWKAAGNEND